MEKIISIGTRIYPYYKDTYLGVEPTGYANKKAAQHYMKRIPAEYVFEAFGGEDAYNMENGYFYGLADKDYLGVDTSKEIPFNTFSKEELSQILEDFGKIKERYYGQWNEKDISFMYFVNKWKMYPSWDRDFKNYRKKEKELRKDIVYKEGVVNITIDFINE